MTDRDVAAREAHDALSGPVSVHRYNALVFLAIEQTKMGAYVEKGQIFATLALAEATMLSGGAE